MAKIHVKKNINGDKVEFLADPRETLLDCLRDHIGLTGSKEGCGTGDCGACSCVFDGDLVSSCLVLGVEAEGKSIETIEGMAGEKELHPLQKKFIEMAALQCGFCTPGLMCSLSVALTRDDMCSDSGLDAVIDGHLCRCTGYVNIRRAAKKAAKNFQGD